MAIADDLRRLDELAMRLQNERDRIAGERARLLALRAAGCVVGGAIICALDPGALQTRADASLALIEQIERFVADVLPQLEAQARKGDAAAATRAVNAAVRIAGAVVNVAPFGDLVVDARRAVDDTLRDLGKTAWGLTELAAVGLGVAVGGKLLRWW